MSLADLLPPLAETFPATIVPRDPQPVELLPMVQHYDWGDPDFIPTLLGQSNPGRRPWAELWMGAHPDAPAQAVTPSGNVPLDTWISSLPDTILGPQVSERFEGRLPFLFKILGVAAPLSLQVHPDERSARAGFAAENRAGVPVDSRQRNYRDPHHKPELVVALGEFYGLRGFRPMADLASALAELPEFRSFEPSPGATPESLKAFYSAWMRLPQESVNRHLDPLLDRVRAADLARPFQTMDREYWLLRADAIYSRPGHRDRGLLAFYLLNLVCLQPGEGMYLPPGVLHAYLHGPAVELMANSNNVLRGGLTTKHIDVGELLQQTRFESESPALLVPDRQRGSRVATYATPAGEFQLTRIEVDEDAPFIEACDHSLEVLIVTSHQRADPVTLRSRDDVLCLGRGQAAVVPANRSYQITAQGPATIYRASVPLKSADQDPSNHPAPLFRGRRPTALGFGTSGLRGLVSDITDLEAYLNTAGYLDYLREIGDLRPGAPVSIAGDLRPSTDSPERSIMRAVALAIEDSGYSVDHLGRLPTPALTYFALQHPRPSIMVTGSHIPFDRNGIKFTKVTGEVLKADEPGILHAVQKVRALEYAKPPALSRFGDDGMFKPHSAHELPPVNPHARREYLQRYQEFLPHEPLRGLRVVFYEHSAVGRDLLVELLTSLGARVLPMARSSQFVPVDTEALSACDLELLQRLADEARAAFGPIDAVISTDGDSDRPLIAGIDENGRVQFLGGDLVGLLVADFLGVNAAAVPVSANDAVDLWAATRGVTLRRTRIGSPYVIEMMHRLCAAGSPQVVGWEANGGFLVATDIVRNGRVLRPLPTRDAALPIVAVLCASREQRLPLVGLFQKLPRRYSRATLIDAVPTELSRTLITQLSPRVPGVLEIEITERGEPRFLRDDGPSSATDPHALAVTRAQIEHRFPASEGYGPLSRINLVDGLRLGFANGDVVHLRPSGNAPQLRIYSVASSPERADTIIRQTTRLLEHLLHTPPAPAHPPASVPMLAPPQSPFVAAVCKNIELATHLVAQGQTPAVVGTVSGSKAAQRFWQSLLDGAKADLHVGTAVSFHEDLPTNQAFGILLLWQRLKTHLAAGPDRDALVAFVFGDGTRSTPFTETDNAQKPAIATFVRASADPEATRPRFLTMVEVALHHFIPVQQFLKRSGFRGLVVKWGDEIQIPTRDLSGLDPLFRDADVVRFVSVRPMDADEAANKDWVGVDAAGNVTAFIPRRPLEEMELLADRGLLQRKDGRLYGGVNLGSIAVSTTLLEALLAEFSREVNDPTASRKDRPALDPEFFTALTVAAIADPEARHEAWKLAVRESADVQALQLRMPDLLTRLTSVLERHESATGRPLRMVAMDFGDQYWGDIGQHAKIFEFYMALNDPGPSGRVARALAHLPDSRDEHGNLIVDSEVSPHVQVRNSVLIHARLTGAGSVDGAVLIGTHARDIEVKNGFDVLSTSAALQIEPRAGTYKIVSRLPVRAAAGERMTSLFLPGTTGTLFRVHESTDLRNKAHTYDVPILGNPLPFRAAHQAMGIIPVDDLAHVRRTEERRIEGLLGAPRSPA
ncbi:MAG: mannose-6-phosphate isomerase, class I [Verrucomicrobiales bacterium]|nr:mannose-6-phosphate isomerase, class I [Verrucomicrobiales bacterium]